MRPFADSSLVSKLDLLVPALAVARVARTRMDSTAPFRDLAKVMIEDTTAGGVL